MSTEGRAYKERVGMLFLAQSPGPRPRFPAESVSVLVELDSTRRRDIDNNLKPLLDALEGRAYSNDRQVSFLSIWRDGADVPVGDLRVTVVRGSQIPVAWETCECPGLVLGGLCTLCGRPGVT
jgi:Holliday junction resolvase RusA-like endonuclease